MAVQITLDRESREPLYRQIYQQLAGLIRDGLLAAGAKIPSVRELAGSLGVSVRTVHNAYEMLAAEHLIVTNHGSGTYVAAHPEVASGANLRTREEMGMALSELPRMQWEPFFFRSEFFLVPHSQRHHGKLIRFTQTHPDPALFPFERIKQIATNMLWYPKEFFFDIGNPQGYQPLVEHLEREMALSGIPMAKGENDIILTGGFQRALGLVLRMILKRGQKVAVESPTYTGILNFLLAERIDYVPIPVDEHGLNTDYLGTVLAQGEVRAIVTVPTYHNPTGVTLSPERREHLLRLAARHRVPVIEDDWGRMLRYEGAAPAPLKALDSGDYVIHIGTFSKCFLPGLRIGWITAPAVLGLPLVMAKLGADSGDSYFLQALLYEFIQRGYFARHLRKTLKEYRRRRNAMCKLLTEHLPAGCRFRTPQGGFSIWLELPDELSSLPLLTLAREAGVEFLPAAFCLPDRKDAPALRLSFSRTGVEDIEAGIPALCQVIRDCLENPLLLRRGAQKYEDLLL